MHGLHCGNSLFTSKETREATDIEAKVVCVEGDLGHYNLKDLLSASYGSSYQLLFVKTEDTSGSVSTAQPFIMIKSVPGLVYVLLNQI